MSAAAELPICILAVLKTGAAYVLLDPAEPPARRAELATAAGAAAILGWHLQAVRPPLPASA